MKKEALNPFLPAAAYIPDGEPHVFNDRVYLFGSHDKEGGETYCMLDYEIWSAPVNDLSDWSSKGPNYSAKQDPLSNDEMKYMYAPDCVRGNDGRYYLYYCLSGDKGQGGYSNPISVAVSDTPDGKYEYLGFVRHEDGSPLTEQICFDPAVINDEGTIRLYFGTDYPWLNGIPSEWLRRKILGKIFSKDPKKISMENLGAYHVTLKDDMLTASSEPIRLDRTIIGKDYKNHFFFEGSSIRKIDGRYYFIYSSANNHELCYAVSKRPDGSYRYGGTIVSNGDIFYQGREPKDRLNHTGTNHGSIEKINGSFYVFYHRLTHNSDYSRQACAERIDVLPDGSIPQVPITSCGLNGGPLKGGSYPAVCCCNLTNGKMRHGSNSAQKTDEPCVTDENGERFITGIRGGTLIGYKYFSMEGEVRLTLTVRGEGGTFETNLGVTVFVNPAEKWTRFSTVFTAPEEDFPLFLTFRGTGAVELKEIALNTDFS